MELHSHNLQFVCRIGEARFTRHRQETKYDVKKYAEDIKTSFGIDVTEDHADTHPPCMCVVCFNVLRRKCQAVDSGADFMYSGGGCGSIVHWKSHSRQSCTFCSEFSHAGRPSKKNRTPSGFFKKSETHTSTNTDTTTCTPPHSTCTHSKSVNTTTPTNTDTTCSDNTTMPCSKENLENSGIDVDSPQVLLDIATPRYKAGTELDSDRFIGRGREGYRLPHAVFADLFWTQQWSHLAAK